MSARPLPPPLAERLLALTVRDEDWRDSIVGDLREEFVMVEKRHGRVTARRWYWRHALSIGSRALTSRLRTRRAERTWMASIDQPSGGGWRSSFTRDLRHAWRTLWRRPATSLVIITTLALTLATNSTSFAIMDAVVLRPFRFPDVDRLVVIASSDPRKELLDRESVALADWLDWRREARSVMHLSAAEWWNANLSGIEHPEQVAGYRVTADFFTALGTMPQLGRGFTADEEVPGNHRRVVLGHALWLRLFAGNPNIVGTSVRLDGEPYEVVGIAPPGLAIPDGAQVWAPLAYSHEQWADRRIDNLTTIARLAPGVSLEEARAELATLAERQRREHPMTNAERPNTVVSFTVGMSDPAGAVFLSVILAASLVLLLIACANIANLLLAQGSERAQEVAMRLALGASRTRLTAQLLLEAGILTSIAVALAIPLAWLGLSLSRASIPAAVIRFVPGWQYLDISPVVFAASAAFGAIATFIFALVPAFQTVRGDVADTLRQSSRSATAPLRRLWLRNTLAGAQVATTFALLFGTTLMLAATDRAVNGALGFDKRNVLVAQVVLPETQKTYADPERRRQFINGVLDRMRAIPAVTHAGMISHPPYHGSNLTRGFYPEGVALQPSEVRSVGYRRITPDYLGAFRIPLLAGRTFNDGDRVDSLPVALVSRLLTDRYWPGADPLGRRFRIAPDGPLVTVVGVVGDVTHEWFQERRDPTVYRPLSQEAPSAHAFAIRTVGDPLSVAGDLRRAVAAMDPDQPIRVLNSMEGAIEERTSALRFIARSLGVVAFIALVLAVMGLYSLMAFMVSRRTQELGVRLALGATRWQVIGLTTMQGVKITVVGLFLGGLAAAAVGRLMESMLFGAVASSAWQLAGLAGLIALVSLLASYVPARRTAGIDPTVALRAE